MCRWKRYVSITKMDAKVICCGPCICLLLRFVVQSLGDSGDSGSVNGWGFVDLIIYLRAMARSLGMAGEPGGVSERKRWSPARLTVIVCRKSCGKEIWPARIICKRLFVFVNLYFNRSARNTTMQFTLRRLLLNLPRRFIGVGVVFCCVIIMFSSRPSRSISRASSACSRFCKFSSYSRCCNCFCFSSSSLKRSSYKRKWGARFLFVVFKTKIRNIGSKKRFIEEVHNKLILCFYKAHAKKNVKKTKCAHRNWSICLPLQRIWTPDGPTFYKSTIW